jgi:hypothetical protein
MSLMKDSAIYKGNDENTEWIVFQSLMMLASCSINQSDWTIVEPFATGMLLYRAFDTLGDEK